MINAQERAKLRGFSNQLKDLVFIGKDGVSDNVIAQIEDNLYAHELIKIKVQRSVVEDISSMANDICEKCECELVAIIGSKIILYKLTSKPKFKHLL